MDRVNYALSSFSGVVSASNAEPQESGYADFDQKQGEYIIRENVKAGGLVAALDPAMQKLGDRAIWVATGTGEADRETVDENNYIWVPVNGDSRYRLLRVFPREKDFDNFYLGYSNRVLWPLFHNVGVNPELGPDYIEYWKSYDIVNSIFANNTVKAFKDIKDESPDNPLVLVNDYHLLTLPKKIREMSGESPCLKDAVITYFHHIPWLEPSIYEKVPHRRELIDGLFGSDLIGFHTDDYVNNFLHCAYRQNKGNGFDVGFENLNGKDVARVRLNGKDVYVAKFPIGIDPDRHRGFAEKGGDGREMANKYLEGGFPENGILMLGVARFDYTKGIGKEIMAIEQLLNEISDKDPEYAKRIRLLQVLAPTREDIPEYREYKERIIRMADGVNKKFMERYGFMPITLEKEGMSHEQLASLYRFADVFLIPATRDGMNLTGFECVASQDTEYKSGVIVMSETIGARDVIGDYSLVVNPNDIREMRDAIKAAIEMEPTEKIRRMGEMQDIVWGNTITDWMADIFTTSAEIKNLKEAVLMRGADYMETDWSVVEPVVYRERKSGETYKGKKIAFGSVLGSRCTFIDCFFEGGAVMGRNNTYINCQIWDDNEIGNKPRIIKSVVGSHNKIGTGSSFYQTEMGSVNEVGRGASFEECIIGGHNTLGYGRFTDTEIGEHSEIRLNPFAKTVLERTDVEHDVSFKGRLGKMCVDGESTETVWQKGEGYSAGFVRQPLKREAERAA